MQSRWIFHLSSSIHCIICTSPSRLHKRTLPLTLSLRVSLSHHLFLTPLFLTPVPTPYSTPISLPLFLVSFHTHTRHPPYFTSSFFIPHRHQRALILRPPDISLNVETLDLALRNPVINGNRLVPISREESRLVIEKSKLKWVDVT